MESRRSHGWGMTGSDKKGFEWELEDEYGKVQSGYVYKTADEAIRECRKFCKESKCREKVRAQRFGRFLPPQGDLNIRGEQ